MSNSVQEYMKLPYTRMVYPVNDESGFYYVGKILEFPGCMTTGDSLKETYEALEEAMELWLETAISIDKPIPEPLSNDNYSGHYALRIPKSLHKRLSIEAKMEGVSFNQYAIYKLSM